MRKHGGYSIACLQGARYYSTAISTATLCLCVQGAVLASSDRGPIRIQFSKNPFGKKRDVSGQLVDARMSGGGSGLEGVHSFDAAAQPAMG